MYYGKLVEVGSAEEIYKYGLHPYTESLLSAIPLPDPEYERHRVRTTYKPEKTTATDLSLREISEDHYVYCSESAVPKYQEKLQEMKKQ